MIADNTTVADMSKIINDTLNSDKIDTIVKLDGEIIFYFCIAFLLVISSTMYITKIHLMLQSCMPDNHLNYLRIE